MNAEVMEAPEMHHHIDRIAATMPNKDVIIGTNIRTRRKARGIHPKTFALTVGVGQTQLGLMEVGSEPISPTILERIATALKCKTAELAQPIPISRAN